MSRNPVWGQNASLTKLNMQVTQFKLAGCSGLDVTCPSQDHVFGVWTQRGDAGLMESLRGRVVGIP